MSHKNKETTRLYNLEYRKKNSGRLKKASRVFYYHHREIMKERNTLFNHSPSGRYCHYKHSAKRRRIIFELTKEDFIRLWKQECTYCGLVIEGVGIDRIDNKLGYTTENCVPCCAWCNIAKNKWSKEEFLEKCRLVTENNRK